MSRLEAASRIVEIQTDLASAVLGTKTRAELMVEQSELWDRYFEGRPYEQIRADAWMEKHCFRYK